MTDKNNIKAVGLVSGGLDSVLAVKLLLDQGISVIGLHFITPFMVQPPEEAGEETLPQRHARQLGFELRTIHPGDEYIQLIKNPQWGYGSCMNPCLDCHIYFLQKAKEVMREEGAQFIFTGEVLEQRPKSQKRTLLRMVEKKSELDGYLLRPLSAHRLEPTIPEKLGWVDREKLLNLAGRNRKPQIALAKSLGIMEYQSPAGGCLLTEPNYCGRLKDLFENNVTDSNSIQMLKIGRHFRLSPRAKLVLGRDERDNRILAQLALESDTLLEADGGGSPLSIVRGEVSDEIITLAAGFTKRFSRARNQPDSAVRIRHSNSNLTTAIIPPIPDEGLLESLRIK